MGFITKKLLLASILGGFVSLFIIVAKNTGWLEQWDLLAYDILISQSSKSQQLSNDVIVIGINEHDIQSKQEWPLSDQSLAQLIQKLLSYSPSVIGVDIYRDILIPPGSKQLIETLQQNPNIYLVEKFSASENEIPVKPNSELLNQDQIGFSDLSVDNDGVVRRGLLFLNNEHTVSFAISLRLALSYLAERNIQLQPNPQNPALVMFGSVTYIPIEKDDGGYVDLDAGGYQYFLSYPTGSNGFTIYSMADVLSDKLQPEALKNKIVIIGVISESVKDAFITPISKTNDNQASTPGVVVHAHATNQLIRSAIQGEKPLKVVDNHWETSWLLLWAGLGLFFAFISNTLLRYIALLFIGISSLLVTTLLVFNAGIWLPVIAPLSAFLDVFLIVSGYIYIQEKQQRNMVMELFSRHVSEDVAKTVWLQRDEFFQDGRLKSQQVTATILFTDLVGYTNTAESLNPEALMEWLNEYMEIMADCVIKNGGMIDDYYGDAIKANFGVPIIKDSEELINQDAKHAVECALEMSKALQKMNEERMEKRLQPIAMRIGIATGPIIVGSLGSQRRLKYTSIGDTVNTAARLESYSRDEIDLMDKEFCSILISESTKDCLSGMFDFKKVGELKLKGKSQGLMAYQVVT